MAAVPLEKVPIRGTSSASCRRSRRLSHQPSGRCGPRPVTDVPTRETASPVPTAIGLNASDQPIAKYRSHGRAFSRRSKKAGMASRTAPACGGTCRESPMQKRAQRYPASAAGPSSSAATKGRNICRYRLSLSSSPSLKRRATGSLRRLGLRAVAPDPGSLPGTPSRPYRQGTGATQRVLRPT